jgi:hypothetical protein
MAHFQTTKKTGDVHFGRLQRLFSNFRKKVSGKLKDRRRYPRGPFGSNPPFGGVPAQAF